MLVRLDHVASRI